MKNYQETGAITKIEETESSYYLSRGIMVCGLSKSYGIIPKVGDMLTVHTKGSSFGAIRGMDLNGETVFYKSDEKIEAERIQWLEENEQKKQEKFKKNKTKMDAQYEALPIPFQRRIAAFRKSNERFRVDLEAYELFCCEQAVLIADSLDNPELIKEFKEKTWDEQIEIIPKLDDGHSGNTFNMSCYLAYWYLKDQTQIIEIHGGLAAIVGSDKYHKPNTQK